MTMARGVGNDNAWKTTNLIKTDERAACSDGRREHDEYMTKTMRKTRPMILRIWKAHRDMCTDGNVGSAHESGNDADDHDDELDDRAHVEVI